jgi:hypothetical protein
VGLVGCAYDQLPGDSGSGAVLGPFKGRVYSIGPQASYFFPFGGEKGYVTARPRGIRRRASHGRVEHVPDAEPAARGPK